MVKKLDPTKLVTYVTSKFLKEKTARVDKEQTWKELIDLYDRYDPAANKKDWFSTLVPSEAFNIVEQSATLIKHQLFTGKDFFDLDIEIEPLKPTVEKAQKNFNNTVIKSNFQLQFERFIKHLALLGSACVYVQPDGSIRPIPVTDFVFTPTRLQSATEADLFIYRYQASLAGVKANKNFSNTENLKAEVFSDAVGTSSTTNNNAGKESQEDICEIMMCFGTVVIDEVATPNVFAVIANRKTLVYFDAKPQNINPFVFCNFKQHPFNAYGIGAVEPVLSELITLQNSVRSLNDELRLKIHAPMKFNANDTKLDPSVIARGLEPGLMIPVDFMDSLQPVNNSNPIINDVFQQILSLKQSINDTTGIVKAIGATNSGAKLANTATEAELIAGQGELGFTAIAKHINEMALIPVLQKMLHYYLANSSEQDDKQLLEEIDKITFHISALGSVLEKRDKIQNLRGLIVDLAQLPPQLSQGINIGEMIKEVVSLTLMDQYDMGRFIQEPEAFPVAPEQAVNPNSEPLPPTPEKLPLEGGNQ